MSEKFVLEIAYNAMMLAMKISAPALLAIMFTGLIISIIQAATQINEQTLSFIPKIFAMTLALAFSGGWILQTFIMFTKNMLNQISLVTK